MPGIAVAIPGVDGGRFGLHITSTSVARAVQTGDVLSCMDANEPIRDKTGALVPRRPAGAGWWRLMLESRWSRKLDEVIILTAAAEGASVAGGDTPKGTVTPSAQRLRYKADAACEQLGDLADAIAKIDRGAYGRCDECGRLMADDWLARDPATRWCPACLVGAMPGLTLPQQRTGSLQLSVPRQRAG